MRKSVTSFLLGLSFVTMAVAAKADVFTTSSTGVDYTINNGGFYVSPLTLGGPPAGSFNAGPVFAMYADGPAYADAGIVLYFNGGLTLGQLQSVTVNSMQGTPTVNVWLDTSGDGQFFAFDSNGLMTSTNGDTYGLGASSVDGSTSFYMQGADGAGSSYTLAQLIAGDDAGVNANTPAALWIGITSPAGDGQNQAYVSSVDVETSATPEPASLALLGTGLLGMVGVLRRRVR